MTTFSGPAGTRVPFEILHDDMLCRPWGLFIVRWKGDEVGRQLSYPERDDCLAMVNRLESSTKKRSAVLPRVGYPARPPETHRGLFSLIGVE